MHSAKTPHLEMVSLLPFPVDLLIQDSNDSLLNPKVEVLLISEESTVKKEDLRPRAKIKRIEPYSSRTSSVLNDRSTWVSSKCKSFTSFFLLDMLSQDNCVAPCQTQVTGRWLGMVTLELTAYSFCCMAPLFLLESQQYRSPSNGCEETSQPQRRSFSMGHLAPKSDVFKRRGPKAFPSRVMVFSG